MIDIHHHYQIKFASRQLGIGLASQYGYNIRYMRLGRFGVQLVKHAGLNIVCVDNSIGCNLARHANAVVAGASADISDHHARFKIKLSDGFFRLFFPFPFLPIQPIGATQTHDRRNGTPCYRMNRLSQQSFADEKQANAYRRSSDSAPFHPFLFSHRLTPFRLHLDALIRMSVALVISLPAAFAADNTLQVIAAGVETSEDAPFVASDYRFLPGDYVYAQFQIAGFAVQTNESGEVRKISLTWEITPQDAKGIALTPPVTGAIKEELNAEDKNWMPKRRASVLLPSFVAAGEFHLRISVKDVFGKTATQFDVPFHIGGTVVAPSPTLTVQDFQFLRKEDDPQGLDVPAYASGDTVYARFNMSAFQLAAGNEYHLSYGLTVTRPDGQVYLNQPNAAQLSDRAFYPVAFVPGNLSITTSRTSPHGQYVLVLTVHDLNGSQTCELRRSFSIE